MHFRYEEWNQQRHGSLQTPFDRLNDIFQQLLLISGSDVAQSLRWLTELDKQYSLTDDAYSLGDFIDELRNRGLIEYDEQGNRMVITPKTERGLRQRSLEELFVQLKKGKSGAHKTHYIGKGADQEPETKPYQFGDDLGQLDGIGTLFNAMKHTTLDQFALHEEDLQVHEREHHSGVATVLMIDLSHSMILYGEDRITPAKKVAMALSELIMTNYPKDSLEIIAFGNEAWKVEVKDLPYLQVGPYHTNTKAGLELARHLLQGKKYANKQIFMITDGKPSCMEVHGKLYKNDSYPKSVSGEKIKRVLGL